MGLIKFIPGQLVLHTDYNGKITAGFIIGQAKEGLTQWFYNVGGNWICESQLTAL